MKQRTLENYWPSLIAQIREINKWNQKDLALKLGVNQASISRWEKGEIVPTTVSQLCLEQLAASAKISSIHEFIQVVNNSPFPMILQDENMIIIAASTSSGFKTGLTVIEQTPADEQPFFLKFADAIKGSGFWSKGGNRFDYLFDATDGNRRAVVQSIAVRGNVYAIVQKVGS